MMAIFIEQILLACLGATAALAQPSVEEIMEKVAANQDRALEQRRAFVYQQHILARFHRGNGKLAREEAVDYLVTPTAKGIEKKLTRFEGKYEKGGRLISYDKPGFEYKDLDIDGDIIHDLIEEMTADKSSRDGIGRDLFPLTREEQRKYTFSLSGTDTYRGRQVYTVHFLPRKMEDGSPWKGEALIDAAEAEPVMVTTKLASRIPVLVKTLLGTNIRGLGFAVSYEKFDDGLWFPVSYGGEFEVRAVFFYKRNMSIALQNAGFVRAQVTTNVAYQSEEAPRETEPPSETQPKDQTDRK